MTHLQEHSLKRAERFRDVYEKAITNLCEQVLNEMTLEFQKRFPTRDLVFRVVHGEAILKIDNVDVYVSKDGETIYDFEKWCGGRSNREDIRCLHFLRDAVNTMRKISDDWRLCEVGPSTIVATLVDGVDRDTNGEHHVAD